MQNVSVYTDVFYLVSLCAGQMSTTSEGARAVALCL